MTEPDTFSSGSEDSRSENAMFRNEFVSSRMAELQSLLLARRWLYTAADTCGSYKVILIVFVIL